MMGPQGHSTKCHLALSGSVCVVGVFHEILLRVTFSWPEHQTHIEQGQPCFFIHLVTCQAAVHPNWEHVISRLLDQQHYGQQNLGARAAAGQIHQSRLI